MHTIALYLSFLKFQNSGHEPHALHIPCPIDKFTQIANQKNNCFRRTTRTSLFTFLFLSFFFFICRIRSAWQLFANFTYLVVVAQHKPEKPHKCTRITSLFDHRHKYMSMANFTRMVYSRFFHLDFLAIDIITFVIDLLLLNTKNENNLKWPPKHSVFLLSLSLSCDQLFQL